MGVKIQKLGIASLQTELLLLNQQKTTKISFLKTKKPIHYELMVQRYYSLRNKQHIFC